MSTIKKVLLFSIFTIIIGSNETFSQTIKENQTNAEYVKELIDLPEVERVFIVAVNKYYEYDKDWLDDISIMGNFITFKSKKEDKMHVWDIKDMIFLEKYLNIIKVRLSKPAGD